MGIVIAEINLKCDWCYWHMLVENQTLAIMLNKMDDTLPDKCPWCPISDIEKNKERGG